MDNHFKLRGLIQGVKVGLDGHSVLEAALEQALERVDLVDVAEQGVDLRRREERLLLQRFQVILQQVAQMLNKRRSRLEISSHNDR